MGPGKMMERRYILYDQGGVGGTRKWGMCNCWVVDVNAFTHVQTPALHMQQERNQTLVPNRATDILEGKWFIRNF